MKKPIHFLMNRFFWLGGLVFWTVCGGGDLSSVIFSLADSRIFEISSKTDTPFSGREARLDDTAFVDTFLNSSFFDTAFFNHGMSRSLWAQETPSQTAQQTNLTSRGAARDAAARDSQEDASAASNDLSQYTFESSTDSLTAGSLTADSLRPGDLAPLDLDERFEQLVTKEELEKELKGLAWKKGDFQITPYGFLWINASFDTNRMVPGEFALYSQSEDLDGTSGSALDARTSRVGLMINGPHIDRLASDVNGALEVDFQGSCNGTKNKGGLQLRKAFVELVNQERQTRWLFGQDWEVISPLYPQMLNYLPAGFAGNIGYRRAQIRFEKGHTWTKNCRTLWQVALVDNVIQDYSTTTGVSARSSEVPLFEARYAVSLGESARNGLPITLGVSGHMGRQIYDFSAISGTFCDQKTHCRVNTWSLNGEIDLPLTKKVRIQSEYFLGENLSGFCGGVNQGIDLFTRHGIRGQGGWVCLHTDWTDKLANNVGYSMDKPFSQDLIGTVLPSNGVTYTRTENSILFTNFIYRWTKNLMTGLEFSYWDTKYRRTDVSGEVPVFLPMKTGRTFRSECVVQLSF